MKRTLGILSCTLLLGVIPLRAQDMEARLAGNSSSQGFTVKNNGGNPLFTIRGDGKVGIGTTTPTGVLTVSGLDGLLVTGTINSGSIPATGAGTRMMFYPKKGAFRAGEVVGSEWDDSNIGLRSIAMGFQTIAGGHCSIAMGLQTLAAGNNSVAMGISSTASAQNATAIGTNAFASGVSSTSMGAGTFASGLFSVAIGYQTTASGEGAAALGTATTASGEYSTTMGYNTVASGDYSTALGNFVNTGSKVGSFVIGDKSTTSTFSAGSVNRFYGRFANGYCLYTNNTCSIAAILYGNANSWATLSDVRKKERFLPVEGEAVLERFRDLRLGTWNYTSQSAEQIRHYGPMAQEWFAAFGRDDIGTIGNDTTLASADVDGVLCIAVQALEKRTAAQMDELTSVNEEVKVLQGQLQEKDREIAQLKSQLAAQQQETDQRYAELVKMVHALQQDRQGQDQRQVMLLKAEAEK